MIFDDHKNNQYEDLVELDDSSLTLSDIENISQDAATKKQYEARYGNKLYQQILLTLTHEKFKVAEARQLWDETRSHLDELTEQLGRNPGISVAIMDFLVNIKNRLDEPVIIEEKKSEFISETSTKDDLTQLYLRSVFDVTLKKEIEKSKRRNSHLVLMMIDVDDFKKVNDTFGHVQGDKVLMQIGGVINRYIRKMDLAARYGGEEIVIIMPDLELEYCLAVAERIKEKISKIHFGDFSVTVSIGISHNIHNNIYKPEQLINNADDALYIAKRKGKNRIAVSTMSTRDEI